MSHALEIDSTTGIAAFVAARETAWHRLGDYQPDRLLTVAEAVDRAHLAGWDVSGVPAGALVDPSDPLSWTPVEGKVWPARTNPFTKAREVLGTEPVGDGFQFWQNEQTAEFAQQITGVFGDEEIVSAAGSMMGGTRVFLSLALDGFTILGDDRHDQFLTVMNGHDGSLSLTGFTGAIRVVCKNTADWAIGSTTNRVKVRHSGDMTVKAGEAADALGVARDWAKAYGEFAEGLASQKVTDKAFEKLVRANFVPEVPKDATPRVANRITRDFDTIMANFKSSPTTEVGRGTKWAALNAITEWAEWGRPGDLTTEKAATANLFGTPATIRAKAVKVLA
jgi:phage/plasmid-like protein (TIGR03299 family)